MIPSADIPASIHALQPAFFDRLPAAAIATILARATTRSFPANKVVTGRGRPAGRLYLILEGRARAFFVEDGTKIPVKGFVPGEVFGGSALAFHPVPYLLSTETCERTTVLEWSRTTIRALADQYRQLHDNAGLIALDYFATYNALVGDLVALTNPQRVAQALLTVAREQGRKVTAGVELRISNEELAAEAHVSEGEVSSCMAAWRRDGWLTKKRLVVIIHSIEELVKRAG